MTDDRPKRWSEIMGAMRDKAELGGMPALALRDIAMSANLSLGSMRHVFPSKDALLLALAGDVLEQAKERQLTALGRSRPFERLSAMLPRDASEIQQVRLELLIRLHAQDSSLSDPVRAAFEAAGRETRRLVGAVCEHVAELATQRSGREPTRLDVMALLALMEGLQVQLATPSAAGVNAGEATGALLSYVRQLESRA